MQEMLLNPLSLFSIDTLTAQLTATPFLMLTATQQQPSEQIIPKKQATPSPVGHSAEQHIPHQKLPMTLAEQQTAEQSI